MNNDKYLELAVRLCRADLSCGFISLEPVLGSRDELMVERIVWYCEQLKRVESQLVSGGSALLPLAVELTCADIQSGAIAVAPVLYDRDEKIDERLIAHVSRLSGLVAVADAEEVSTASAETDAVCDKPVTAAPALPPVRAIKGKKKKKRR